MGNNNSLWCLTIVGSIASKWGHKWRCKLDVYGGEINIMYNVYAFQWQVKMYTMHSWNACNFKKNIAN